MENIVRIGIRNIEIAGIQFRIKGKLKVGFVTIICLMLDFSQVRCVLYQVSDVEMLTGEVSDND